MIMRRHNFIWYYHVINIEASELAMAVLEALGFSSDSSHNIGGRGLSPAHLKFLSRGLVFWLCPLLSAKRSEVRIAAIKAITRCVFAISCAPFHIASISPCLLFSLEQVREAVAGIIEILFTIVCLNVALEKLATDGYIDQDIDNNFSI